MIAIVTAGVWILNRPLPRISPPPIDEALDRSTDDRTKWEVDAFTKLDEPQIKNVSPQANEVYRMTLLPTFDRPIVISVVRSADKLELRTKVMSGMGGFGVKEMGKISENQTRDLAPDDFEALRRLLDEAHFWEIPVKDHDDGPIIDGSIWILEGRLEGSARSVSRTMPKQSLCSVFWHMLALSGRKEQYEHCTCSFDG